MLSNSSDVVSAAGVDPAGQLQQGFQLGFVLLAAVSAVPPVCVARDIVTSCRQLSPLDELLLVRELIIIVWKPLTNMLVIVREQAHGSIPPALLYILCLSHGMSIVIGVGLVTIANFLISFNRIEQLLASRLPTSFGSLTERRIRWQNRALLLISLVIFVGIPLIADLHPSAYYWCMSGSEPKEPPMLTLLTINSSFNCVNFCFSIYLWKASSGLQDTGRPRNYIPASCWAQLCLIIILAKTLLVPLNTDNFDTVQKIYLNHAFFTVLYGLLDPCLLMLMAARWRQQVRDYRLQIAEAKESRKPNMVIPTIRLDLI